MYEFKKAEDEVLMFWKKNKIYDKVKDKNKKGKKFYFMDGPPYATGHIHMGTALNKILKDVAMRFKRLQGHDVFDRPGYDTHGLPIEFQVEKEIGLKSKKDIESYGVKKFVDKCKDYATRYIDVMNKDFRNLGVWMDWDNPYITLEDYYIEAIWHTFKEADKKGLLYLGKYSVHVCPRCETAVAYNEIEYAKEDDSSVFVKFPIKGKKNSFLLIWTTTPWTLPANTGIMVNPTVDYQEVELSNGEKWIIAKELVQNLMNKIETSYTVKSNFKGKKIENLEYETPLAKNLKLKIKNGYKVVLSGRYVTTEEGTGLVHCAPGHGKEDFEVGVENNLDIICPVGINGILTEEAGKYSGKKAREVDKEIIADLENDGFLVYKHKYSHDYPHCWRCKSPLLMLAQPQWYLKISEIQKKLIQENEKVNWVPDYMKLKMKAWLEGIGDWPISRQRYWGAPIPIWYNPESKEKVVIGSIRELKKLSGKNKIKLHKPDIDKIEIKGKSGKLLKRVPEVLDVWFDSGVSSWAALGYPSKNKEFEKFWPADLNIEGRDMFRGWWNSQIILSQIAFGKKPFNNIAVHGMVLDLGKTKMSKSLGNIIAPQDIIEKYGRDYLRYYMSKMSKGEDFAFNEKEFNSINNSFRVLLNLNNFINQLEKKEKIDSTEDSWILSKLHQTIKEVTALFNKYKFYEAIEKLEKFLINDVSKTYIQIVRERADEVYDILNEIRINLLKLCAPIIPFTTEKIWQELKKKNIVKEESVHLSSWPIHEDKKINLNLEKDFEIILRIIEKGLAERDNLKIGLKWPLRKAIVHCPKIPDSLIKIIAKQLNVREVEFKSGLDIKVDFDTKTTPELEAEGFAREIVRRVQAERKNRGLKKSEKIELKISVDEKLKKMLQANSVFIKERTGSKKLDFSEHKDEKWLLNFEIKGNSVYINF